MSVQQKRLSYKGKGSNWEKLTDCNGHFAILRGNISNIIQRILKVQEVEEVDPEQVVDVYLQRMSNFRVLQYGKRAKLRFRVHFLRKQAPIFRLFSGLLKIHVFPARGLFFSEIQVNEVEDFRN